jgi:hypothetical protein
MRGHRIGRAGLAGTSAAILLGLGTGCGGGGIGLGHNTIATPADNVAEVAVDFGLPDIFYLNGLFATATVCVPGTSDCQDIDHLLVDTGSSGLRVLSSVLTLTLPTVTDAGGGVLSECGQFVSGFIWGTLATADVKLAGEQASDITVQIIDERAYPVPSDCTGVGANTAETLGANGILGIGSFLYDCGAECAAPVGGTRSSNPGTYYACSSRMVGGCQATAVPLSKQVANPVGLFSQDNNGTIIELPAIPAYGTPGVAGALVFGIGTRENNGLNHATVIQLSSWSGTFLSSYPPSGSPSIAFVDSGSNGIYFLDSVSTKIPTCSAPIAHFYCPGSTLNLSARNQDNNGRFGVTVNFSIANARALLSNQNNFAFDNVGGPSVEPSAGSGSANMSSYFDWGLPFYFGRNVFTALEGRSTPAGVGPFVAF